MKKYLAVDLGGTAIKYGVVDEELNFLSKGKVDSRCNTWEEFLEDIGGLWKEFGEGTEGIAISMPGMALLISILSIGLLSIDSFDIRTPPIHIIP